MHREKAASRTALNSSRGIRNIVHIKRQKKVSSVQFRWCWFDSQLSLCNQNIIAFYFFSFTAFPTLNTVAGLYFFKRQKESFFPRSLFFALQVFFLRRILTCPYRKRPFPSNFQRDKKKVFVCRAEPCNPLFPGTLKPTAHVIFFFGLAFFAGAGETQTDKKNAKSPARLR